MFAQVGKVAVRHTYSLQPSYKGDKSGRPPQTDVSTSPHKLMLAQVHASAYESADLGTELSALR